MIDVFLNFRTGFTDSTNVEIMDQKLVAMHYLHGWCFLDILSSLPIDRFTSFNSQILKLLKIGKVARAFKILKPEQTKRITEIIDDHMSSFMQRCRRRSGVFVLMFVL